MFIVYVDNPSDTLKMRWVDETGDSRFTLSFADGEWTSNINAINDNSHINYIRTCGDYDILHYEP
jgi:hypothetical protein